MTSYKVFLILALLVSCGVVDNDEQLTQQETELLYIDYLGIVSVDGGNAASFSLVNDSTDAIQFFGYSESFPLYNAETLSDTGWTNMMWGWCGTGAEFQVLEPDSSIHFLTVLPNSSVTWRLVLDISDMDSVHPRRLRSENINYTSPQN